MTIKHTSAEVDRLRARLASDPRPCSQTLALALADQLGQLSVDLAMRGDYDAAAACDLEAVKVLAAHIDPLTLPPAEEFRYAGIVSSIASGLLIDGRAGDAIGLLDHAIDVHARLAHLAGQAIEQPTFGPPPPPPTPEEEAQHVTPFPAAHVPQSLRTCATTAERTTRISLNSLTIQHATACTCRTNSPRSSPTA